jgi:hypothetical protein
MPIKKCKYQSTVLLKRRMSMNNLNITTKDDTRNINGGSYHCDYCGWATWGASAMKSHQKAKHNCGKLFGNQFAYHFHLIGKYNCNTTC